MGERIEILHYRDPDSDCTLRLFVNGVEVNPAEMVVEDVDPGRGYTREDWTANREHALAGASEAFAAAVRAAYDDGDESRYVEGEYTPEQAARLAAMLAGDEVRPAPPPEPVSVECPDCGSGPFDPEYLPEHYRNWHPELRAPTVTDKGEVAYPLVQPTAEPGTCACGHTFGEHDPIDDRYAGACADCDCDEYR